MDAKITLAFDENVITKAKKFAENNNISLSRLTEYIFRKITSGDYNNLEDLPIADWVHTIAEGDTEYHHKTKSRQETKKEYRERK
ncbi:MAG: hypothetical protein DI598_04910 [Pseudopedobacter saltans]|uniref:Uncharacterized protein n=1 Tax=Pseudopedobacter saltans TaxID=151895 RepID=A0A2W5F5M1_9SPHI|nr:MAG: hypothetical protein DI598_04910 [Pseudopedobacter saltans]